MERLELKVASVFFFFREKTIIEQLEECCYNQLVPKKLMEEEHMIKKVFAVLITTALVTSSFVFADGNTIKDIDKSSSYAKASIAYLAAQNVIKGDHNGNYSPQKPITRAEMVALLARVMALDTSVVPAEATFQDVPLGHWSNQYVEAAYKEGIITGINATEFRPSDIITREQMAIVFVRALKLTEPETVVDLTNINSFADKNQISSWAKKEVEIALEAGLMTGKSSMKFEPKSQANKEQAAVVVERLLKNKGAIISAFKGQAVSDEGLKLKINNEAVRLTTSPKMIDGKVYLPMELINKYMLDIDSWDIAEDALTFRITPIKSASDIKTVWFQVGSSKAYKNYETDPFAMPEKDLAKELELHNTPIQVDGKTYIAADDIIYMLGYDHYLDNENNSVTIYHGDAGTSPVLYHALKTLAYYDYLGDTRAQAVIKISNQRYQHYIVKTSETDSRQNSPTTVQYNTKDIIEQTGKLSETLEQHVIIMDDKMYEKDLRDNKWKMTNISKDNIYYTDLLFDPIYEDSYIDTVSMNQIIFDNFGRLEVKNAGTANISGIQATKYVIQLDRDTIKNTMPAEEYQYVKEMLDSEFRNGVAYTYEFYVANNNIIKQTYQFNGYAVDNDGTPVDFYARTDIYYKNIGKQISITAPAASLIK